MGEDQGVAKPLNERQITVLKTLVRLDKRSPGRYFGAGQIWHEAFSKTQPYRGRRDAGMTRTLDSLGGLVEWDVHSYLSTRLASGGRNWRISEAGRAALDV
jgi:hypothetical protein